MKKVNLKVGVLALSVLAIGMTSCNKKGCTDANAINYEEKAKKDDGSCEFAKNFAIEETTVGGATYMKVTGTIDENVTLEAANKYLLSGGVFVDGGATLTIEAGTMIYAADDNTTPFLAVKQGAKINAVGTASAPIVFTSIKDTPAAGDWGGIIINGYGILNSGATAEGEGGTGTYGGTDNTDNSGTMSYVRLEYAGKQLTTDNELNGFAFQGVGSGTTLDHLQAYKCADDGFEFFGGAAVLNYALSFGSGDDSFDWTEGWQGAGSNWYVLQTTGAGDRGIEADNNSDNNSASPFSNPTLTNIKIEGNGASAGKVGIKLREGTMADITNVEVVGFATAFEIQHDVTLNNVKNGDLTIAQGTSTNCDVETKFKSSNSDAQLETDAETAGNVTIDGSANVDMSWYTGASWYSTL